MSLENRSNKLDANMLFRHSLFQLYILFLFNIIHYNLENLQSFDWTLQDLPNKYTSNLYSGSISTKVFFLFVVSSTIYICLSS